jgi:hypothetical protein
MRQIGHLKGSFDYSSFFKKGFDKLNYQQVSEIEIAKPSTSQAASSEEVQSLRDSSATTVNLGELLPELKGNRTNRTPKKRAESDESDT